MQKTRPQTAISVSRTDHVLRVCGTVRPRYSFNCQNPASFIGPKATEPAPVTRTINSAETPVERARMGATIPDAVAIATVEEPEKLRQKKMRDKEKKKKNKIYELKNT